MHYTGEEFEISFKLVTGRKHQAKIKTKIGANHEVFYEVWNEEEYWATFFNGINENAVILWQVIPEEEGVLSPEFIYAIGEAIESYTL